jgi:hypothetical protein
MKTIIALISFSLMSSAALAEEYEVNCLDRKVCPAVYRPADCVYQNDIKASGTNKCQAVSRIEEILCAELGAEKIKIDTNDFVCL